MQITRRSALRGGTAVALSTAAITAAGAVAALAAVDKPLLDLEQQLKDANAIADHIWEGWNTRYERLPAWAAPGPDGHGRDWGWPDVSDLPEFKGLTDSELLTKRPGRGMVEAYNRWAEECAAHDSLADAKAEGRSRIRAWNARQQEKAALYKELGISGIDDRLEPHLQRRDDLEYRITETPACR